MTLPKFEYFAPKSLAEAHGLFREKGDGAYLLAGGTDLLVKMNHGLLKPKSVIALKPIEGLDEIHFDPQKGLTIGATTLLSVVATHPDVLGRYPAVAAAANETANVQIRNMGTVAGNLCNAAPSADNAPTFLALNAKVRVAGLDGEREVALEEFFKGPGKTALAPGEILTSIQVPPPAAHSGVSYRHISARGKVDISAVCVGAMIMMDQDICQDVRIFLGAVGPTPLRAEKAEGAIRGKGVSDDAIWKAGQLASDTAQPISDVRASDTYRKEMTAVLTRRALREARDRAMNS